jgi:DNA-binding PadR family transcriptional regulator
MDISNPEDGESSVTQKALPPGTEAEPLRPVVFAILVSLNDQNQHGYGIMKRVNEQLRRRALLGPGTLYRILKELRDDGLIDYATTPAGADARRRYYSITPEGRRVARNEASRMAAWVEVARDGRLLDAEAGG